MRGDKPGTRGDPDAGGSHTKSMLSHSICTQRCRAGCWHRVHQQPQTRQRDGQHQDPARGPARTSRSWSKGQGYRQVYKSPSRRQGERRDGYTYRVAQGSTGCPALKVNGAHEPKGRGCTGQLRCTGVLQALTEKPTQGSVPLDYGQISLSLIRQLTSGSHRVCLSASVVQILVTATLRRRW